MEAPAATGVLHVRIHVFGASSAVGCAVVEQAISHGYSVLGYSRGRPALTDSAALWQPCDLDDPDAHKGLDIRSTDLLISSAPLRKVVPLLERASHIRPSRVVAISSASAVTKKLSEWSFDRALSEELRQCEARLLEQLGAAATVLRPTMIYGSGRDRNVARLAAWMRRWRCVPILSSSSGMRAPIHIDDLAAVAIRVAETGFGSGAILHVPGGERVSYRLMLERIAKGCGVAVAAPRIPCPPGLLMAVGAMMPKSAAKLFAAASRMGEDLTVPDDVVGLGVQRRAFHPDLRALGLRSAGQT